MLYVKKKKSLQTILKSEKNLPGDPEEFLL